MLSKNRRKMKKTPAVKVASLSLILTHQSVRERLGVKYTYIYLYRQTPIH